MSPLWCKECAIPVWSLLRFPSWPGPLAGRFVVVVFGFATATRVCGTQPLGWPSIRSPGLGLLCASKYSRVPPSLLELVPFFCSLFLSRLLVHFSPSVSLPLAQSCRLRERGARVAFSRGSLPAGRRRPPWSEGSLCVPRRGSMLPSPTAGPPSSSPPDRLAERSPWKGQGKREVLALPWGPS